MLQIFIPLLIIGIITAFCMCRHFALTKEFNPLWFTLDAEVQEAETRQIKPCIEPTPIPMSHKINYILDWAIVIAVIIILFS
jgi:hypothetical protein